MKTNLNVTSKDIDSTNDRVELITILEKIYKEIINIKILLSATKMYFNEEEKIININWQILINEKRRLNNLYQYASNKLMIIKEKIKKENIERNNKDEITRYKLLFSICKQMCDKEIFEQIIDELYKQMDKLKE